MKQNCGNGKETKMAVLNSVTGALVRLVVIVAFVGAILGLAISGTEVLNPKTSVAKQRQIEEQTRHQATINVLQEQQMAEETKAKLERRKRQAELELEMRQIRGYVIAASGGLALVIISVGLAILLVRLGRRWISVPQKTSDSSSEQRWDPWKSQAFRDARIREARAKERELRRRLDRQPKTRSDSYWPTRISVREPILD
jgi:hypothetical protein